MALGVIYDDPRPTFEDSPCSARTPAARARARANLAKLLAKGQTWTVLLRADCLGDTSSCLRVFV
jgi:2-oxoglutarate ferredoxin oxidoreductase subunit beta